VKNPLEVNIFKELFASNVKEGEMAKLTAWLVTLVGALLVLQLFVPIMYSDWIIALSVLIVGIGKLLRNYGMMKKGRR